MKLIVAIIRPEKLRSTLAALFHEEIRGLSVSRIQGHGGETDIVETYRGAMLHLELHEKIRLEIAVSEPFVDRAVRTIMEAARTGRVGDGKIFVLPLEKAYRIRTGEEDEAAITPVETPSSAHPKNL